MCNFLAKIGKFIWQTTFFIVIFIVSLAVLKTIFT